MNKAWQDSKAGTPASHEEGGFIFWKPGTNAIDVVGASSGAAHEIDLMQAPEYRDDKGKSWALVGTFHTHPNYPNPSGWDLYHANQGGVPGIVKHGNNVSVYGPNRRGGNIDRLPNGAFTFGGPYGFPGTDTPSLPGCS